jgi:tRNA(Ile)-lysidine synthase
MPDTVMEKVKNTISSNKMLVNGETLLVGVSGGSDSMCLLDVMIKLSATHKYNIEVCHVNHSLRGEDSVGDLEFVRKYCNARNIPFHSISVDVPKYTRKHKVGTEEAARILRYEFFNKISQPRGLKVAIAHHLQDQAETILLNIMRGSGTYGLAGIRAVSGNVIRPLLDCTKAEIESYIETLSVEYRTDKTNDEPCAERNKIRLQLIPFMNNLFERDITDALLKTRGLCLEDDLFIEKEARKLLSSINEYSELKESKEAKDENSLPVSVLSGLDFALSSRIVRILYEKVRGDKKNLTLAQTKSLIKLTNDSKDGKSINLCDGYCGWIHNGRLVISTNEKRKEFLSVKADKKDRENSYINSLEVPFEVPSQIDDKIFSYIISTKFVENNADIVYNAMTWSFPLKMLEGSVWRSKREGDFIRPNSRSGSKSIKKFLTEKKISSKERSGLLFLAKGSEVLFIPKVTGSHSNSILQTSNSSSEEIYKSNGSFPKDEETLVSITVTNRS